MNSLRKPANSFEPAWWLPDGHSQTLWRKLAPPKPIELTRQRIELKDTDFIDIDWAGHAAHGDEDNELVVVVLHGLCGCSSSPYIAELQAELDRRHIPSVAMNFRGCSGEINRLARAYHSGVTEDLDEVFSNLMLEYPDKKFAFVGYSLGANVLLKWLGELAGHDSVYRAVAVSTPFSLAHCSRAMLRGISQFYGKYFVSRLLRDFNLKKDHFEKNGNVEQLQIIKALGDFEGIQTIWEFDDRITAPLHGFNNADDYYSQSSSIGFLGENRTDTLLIQSANDPMIPACSLPDRADLAANIELELCSKGGHVGFNSSGRSQWLSHRIANFIEA